MNELLQAIKVDLTSRRLLPLLVVFVVGLLGALAYAALGGNSAAKPPAPIAAAPLAGGLPVIPAPPNATEASSETPAGVHFQTKGPTRNPFKPLVTPPAPKTSAGASASSGSSSGSSTSKANSGSGRNGSSAGGSAKPVPAPEVPAPTHKASTPKQDFKPRPLQNYIVSALFGPAPATPGAPSALTPYEDMKQFEPLPSAKTPLVVFMGVAKTGDQAVFALIVPPILRGPATCYPSPTQCQAIELLAGQDEELEYTKTDGQIVAFEVQVVRIAKRTASAANAKSPGQSKAGRLALLRTGLWSLR